MDLNRIKRKQIALVTGWDNARISRYLNGKMIPSIEHAKTMAVAAGVNFEELCEYILKNKENNNGR
jgi:transcriptional regulator with XRE-family HTH domain